jgi:hypothetical protein
VILRGHGRGKCVLEKRLVKVTKSSIKAGGRSPDREYLWVPAASSHKNAGIDRFEIR